MKSKVRWNPMINLVGRQMTSDLSRKQMFVVTMQHHRTEQSYVLSWDGRDSRWVARS